MGDTAWAPEVGAQRAPKLLVHYKSMAVEKNLKHFIAIWQFYTGLYLATFWGGYTKFYVWGVFLNFGGGRGGPQIL